MSQPAAPVEPGHAFVRAWADNAERLAATYDASQEHDACGVGWWRRWTGGRGGTWCRRESMH